jgi:NAD(P)-dependent dehydrogenase (short-subunit alcohol dehydrogenase family)
MRFDFSGLGFARGDGVVVTGAASGIGRATAILAAQSGLTVVGWDMAADALDAVVAEIVADGGSAHAVVCDVSDQASIDTAWDTSTALASIPYLVNNAGPPSGTDVPLVEGLRLSIGSMAAVTDAWLARVGDDASSVTFTSSVAGNFTSSSGATSMWYPVGKTAIATFAREMAVQRRGRPRANAVAPSLFETPRMAHMLAAATSEEALRRLPLGRIAQPEDVAACICFLLSPAASFVNGILFPVDGASSWV